MTFQKGVKCRRQVRHVGNPCRVLLGQEREAANVSIANDETIWILCMLWLWLWLVAGASLQFIGGAINPSPNCRLPVFNTHQRPFG
jgi:hypothetical protein